MTVIDTEKATAILRNNDCGGYTVPTHGLYPFQWSWDSAITALGWLHVDEERAWEEAETMFRGQWDNGMVPHILFHKPAGSYFPGPEIWCDVRRGKQAIPSSSISQPPIWATAIRMLYENSRNQALAAQKLLLLLPNLLAYHRWWYRERDPNGSGLVCSFHPWESGMDNSPAWDAPLSQVPVVNWAYQRRDLGHVGADQRPRKSEYDRYLYLVDFYKRHGFASDYIFRNCPYRVADVGIIAILHRATTDLIQLCRLASWEDDIESLHNSLARTEAAMHSLWSDEQRCFLSRDLVTGEPLNEITTGTVLPLFAQLATSDQADAMAALISEWQASTTFALSSTHPASARYESQRYWRGPVWIHMNWLIALGLQAYGHPLLAQRIKQSSQDVVGTAGFWEYFAADSGAGCGGSDFSWTAAMALHWLADE